MKANLSILLITLCISFIYCQDVIEKGDGLQLEHLDSQVQIKRYSECMSLSQQKFLESFKQCSVTSKCQYYYTTFKKCLYQFKYSNFKTLADSIIKCKDNLQPVDPLILPYLDQSQQCAQIASAQLLHQNDEEDVSQLIIKYEHLDSARQIQVYRDCIQQPIDIKDDISKCQANTQCVNYFQIFKKCIYNTQYNSFKQLSTSVDTCKNKMQPVNPFLDNYLKQIQLCANQASQYLLQKHEKYEDKYQLIKLEHLDSAQQIFKFRNCMNSAQVSYKENLDKCFVTTDCMSYVSNYKNCLYDICKYSTFATLQVCINTCRQKVKPVHPLVDKYLEATQLCADVASKQNQMKRRIRNHDKKQN